MLSEIRGLTSCKDETDAFLTNFCGKINKLKFFKDQLLVGILRLLRSCRCSSEIGSIHI